MSVVDELIIRMRTIGAATAAGEVGGVERGIGQLGSTAKTAAGVAGVGALAFGIKDITQAAITFQAQTQQLGQALRNTGQYSVENLSRLTSFADTLSTHGGYDPSTTLSGIQRLIAAHDSVTQAIKDETLATDMARSGQTSYATAVRTMSIVEQGRTTGLSRLGIAIQPVKTAEDALTQTRLNGANALRELEARGITLTTQQRAQYELNHQITPQMVQQAKAADVQATKVEALRVIWQRFHGQVAAFSGSPEGALENFRHSIDVLGQRLGTFLLPIITALAHGLAGVATDMGKVVEWFGRNHTAAIILRDVVTGLVIAWAAWRLGIIDAIAALQGMSIAEMADAAATSVLNAVETIQIALLYALDAIPIVLVIVAIIAAIVLLIYHFGQVKAAVIDAWHWLEQAGKDAFTWLKGAVTDARNWLGGAWHEVAGILAWPFVQLAHGVSSAFQTVKSVVLGVIQWIGGALSTVGEAIAGTFKTALNFVIWLVDKAIQGVNHLIDLIPNPGDWFGASIPHIPLIPQLASGTPMVLRSGVFQVGERGPEKVVLPAGAAVLPNGQLPSWARGSGDTPLLNTVILKIGEREFARAVTRSFAAQKASS